MSAHMFKFELSELFGTEIQCKTIFTPEEALEVQREGKCRALLFFTSAVNGWMVNSIHPAALPRGGTHCTGGWVGPRESEPVPIVQEAG
jgi:hypothetical protein